MPLSRLTACVGVALSAVGVLAAARPATSPTRSAVADDAEVRRIQIHLDSALSLLETNSGSQFTAVQRTRRAIAIENLRTYRNRGVFPHNYDFSERTPYFVDRKTGTLCAVAYLMASTGRSDMISRVAKTDNNVRVPQLASDTAFTQWLSQNGLTLDEAAFIQVVYSAQPSNAGIGAFVVGSLSLIPSVTTSLWNLSDNRDGHRTRMSRVGVVSGLVTLVAGAQMRVSNADLGMNPYANATMAIGATTMALSIHSIMNHSKILADEREVSRHRVADASIAPMVAPDLSRTGVTVSLRF